MSDMGLVVVGAAGRMGQALIRTIAAIDGVRLAGAIERPGSPQLGRDAGELAGAGACGVSITDDPLPVFARADGVLDFTSPAATVEFAGYSCNRRSHNRGTFASAHHGTGLKCKRREYISPKDGLHLRIFQRTQVSAHFTEPTVNEPHAFVQKERNLLRQFPWKPNIIGIQKRK